MQENFWGETTPEGIRSSADSERMEFFGAHKRQWGNALELYSSYICSLHINVRAVPGTIRA